MGKIILESIKTIKIQAHRQLHVCANCGHHFHGKICNECGEKKFNPDQLSIKYFFHHAVDIFTHFENKVLKSIWLILSRPGFITKENLRGVRVRFAKPVQLFIVVNLIFYLFVSYLNRTDYVPSAFDNHGSFISSRPFLHWVAPLDNAIAVNIDSLRTEKIAGYSSKNLNGISYRIFTNDLNADTTANNQVPNEINKSFLNKYDQKVSFFSKTLVFLLIPVFALLFYIFFFRRLSYYGAALILSTHFLVYNLLFYMLFSAINILPNKLFGSTLFSGLLFKGTNAILYNDWMSSFSTAVFGIYNGYEALHIIFWGVWLFVAFKRLFNLPWWQNLLASYFLSRLFFILIFGLYKKFLIAFTIWSM